jgi:lipid-A-disaccharide synthase
MGDLLLRIMPVPSVVLVNLILDKPAMPEFLQDRCDAAEIALTLLHMLQNDNVNAHYRDMLGGFRAAMRQAGEKPADRAAALTLSMI